MRTHVTNAVNPSTSDPDPNDDHRIAYFSSCWGEVVRRGAVG